MPYITDEVKANLDNNIDGILETFDYYSKNKGGHGVIAGSFTYVVYRLLGWFNQKFWMRALGMGCLVMAMMEMYRRKHAEYEDSKIKENGDVAVP